jgi:hypothetical protein
MTSSNPVARRRRQTSQQHCEYGSIVPLQRISVYLRAEGFRWNVTHGISVIDKLASRQLVRTEISIGRPLGCADRRAGAERNFHGLLVAKRLGLPVTHCLT